MLSPEPLRSRNRHLGATSFPPMPRPGSVSPCCALESLRVADLPGSPYREHDGSDLSSKGQLRQVWLRTAIQKPQLVPVDRVGLRPADYRRRGPLEDRLQRVAQVPVQPATGPTPEVDPGTRPASWPCKPRARPRPPPASGKGSSVGSSPAPHGSEPNGTPPRDGPGLQTRRVPSACLPPGRCAEASESDVPLPVRSSPPRDFPLASHSASSPTYLSMGGLLLGCVLLGSLSSQSPPPSGDRQLF